MDVKPQWKLSFKPKVNQIRSMTKGIQIPGCHGFPWLPWFSTDQINMSNLRLSFIYIEKTDSTPWRLCFSTYQIYFSNLGRGSSKDHLAFCIKVLSNWDTSFYTRIFQSFSFCLSKSLDISRH